MLKVHFVKDFMKSAGLQKKLLAHRELLKLHFVMVFLESVCREEKLLAHRGVA